MGLAGILRIRDYLSTPILVPCRNYLRYNFMGAEMIVKVLFWIGAVFIMFFFLLFGLVRLLVFVNTVYEFNGYKKPTYIKDVSEVIIHILLLVPIFVFAFVISPVWIWGIILLATFYFAYTSRT